MRFPNQIIWTYHDFIEVNERNGLNIIDPTIGKVAYGEEVSKDQLEYQLMMTIGPLINHKDFKRTQLYSKYVKSKRSMRSVASVSETKLYEDNNTSDSLMNPDAISDIFKIFTQKKLSLLFSMPVIKYLFKYYCESPDRVMSHKAMKKCPSKYNEVKKNLYEVCHKPGCEI